MLLPVAFILTQILASHFSNYVSDLSASSPHWQSKNVFSTDFAITDRSQILPFELIILLKHVQTFFSFFHIQNSGLSISSIPISGILSGIYALIRSGILFWHLFRFFFEMGAAGPQPRAPVVLRSTTCLSSTCGKTMWEILGAATQLLFVFFFAAHQCAFWNANLCFFVFAGVVFGTPISSVFLLVRTFQGKRKQNNDCFRRLSFGFTLLRDF